jgi:hypothetical protein
MSIDHERVAEGPKGEADRGSDDQAYSDGSAWLIIAFLNVSAINFHVKMTTCTLYTNLLPSCLSS